MTEEITIKVYAETARLYRAADEQWRLKASVMLALGLRDSLSTPRSIMEVFEEINGHARARGMDDAAVRELLAELKELS